MWLGRCAGSQIGRAKMKFGCLASRRAQDLVGQLGRILGMDKALGKDEAGGRPRRVCGWY